MIRQMALFLAGIIAGVFGSLVLESTPRLWMIYFTFLSSLCLTSYGFELDRPVTRWIRGKNRENRIRGKILIGVLGDINWNSIYSEISSWTNTPPEEWNGIFKKTGRISSRKAFLQSSLIKYNVILNPYSGIYPEIDTINLVNLEKIFQYVAGGGIFVNTSDIPGYWAYDISLKHKIDATPSIYGTVTTGEGRIGLTSARPFEMTPFMKRLSIQVISNEFLRSDYTSSSPIIPTQTIPMNANRFAVVEKNIRPVITVTNGTQALSPLFSVPYGKGMFLFCLYHLDAANAGLRNVLAETILSMAKENVK